MADSLKLGKLVHPESYSSITMLCTDLVGFTKTASRSTPLEIVQLLSGLYSYHDDITGRHSAYKVETIGDAYVVVSGCPIRNKNRHATAIALLALDFFAVVTKYNIPHLPGELLQSRGGIHSGPVLAGVVGIKMPRYCLFGETCIITEQMESNSVPNRLHVSHETVKLFEKGDFILESRGSMEIEKQKMLTYFLNGVGDNLKRNRDSVDAKVANTRNSKKRVASKLLKSNLIVSNDLVLKGSADSHGKLNLPDKKSLNNRSSLLQRTSLRSSASVHEKMSMVDRTSVNHRTSLLNRSSVQEKTSVVDRASMNPRTSLLNRTSVHGNTNLVDRTSLNHRTSLLDRKSQQGRPSLGGERKKIARFPRK